MPIDISKLNFNGERIFLSKSGKQISAPDLLNVQVQAFKEFLQEDVAPNERKDTGMQAVFQEKLPYYRFQGNCAS